jgi:TolB-like protein
MHSSYRFGEFRLDPVRRLLFGRDDRPLSLKSKAFDVLLSLVEHAGELVDRRMLLDAVWPHAVVEENNLDQAISALRRRLGETPQQHRFIVTELGRGYRFVAHVETVPTVNTPSGGSRRAIRNDAHSVSAAVDEAPLTSLEATAISIAVLPLVSITGPDDEYFANGLTEELLDRLSGVPELKVAARSSSFYFKDRNEPIRTVGRLLGVRYVLSGSVRRSGDALRVTVRIDDAHEGTNAWSHRFERVSSELFAIQDEIALAVVEHLELALIDETRSAVTRRGTNDAAVQDLYYRAKHLSESMELDSLDEAIAYYERAIALDPSYARAYVGLADALRIRFQVGEVHPLDPSWERACDLLRKSLELDRGSADAHAVLGALFWRRYDYVNAQREIAFAKRLDPGGLRVLETQYFYYLTCGWPPERIVDYAKRFAAADPLNPYAAQLPGIGYWILYDFATALREFERLLERFPTYAPIHFSRYMTLYELGRHADALDEAKRLIDLYDYSDFRTFLGVAYACVGDLRSARKIYNQLGDRRDKYWSPTYRGVLLLEMGDRQRALEALEQAYADRDWALPPALHYKMLAPLHGEPRFERLVDMLGQRPRVERLVRWLRER